MRVLILLAALVAAAPAAASDPFTEARLKAVAAKAFPVTMPVRPEVRQHAGHAWAWSQASARWEPCPVKGYTFAFDQASGQWAKAPCPCGPGCQCPPGQCPSCPVQGRPEFAPMQPVMMRGGFGGNCAGGG